MKQPDSVKDIARHPGQPLAAIDQKDQIPLPPPFDTPEFDPPLKPLSDDAREKYVVLDDTIAVNIPKPQSKEAAILMIADQVEAASRTLQDPTPGQIRGLIRRITQATIQDGQLSECDITMKELGEVAKAFERVLTGMYHHRIEYPGFDFNKRKVETSRIESQSVQ